MRGAAPPPVRPGDRIGVVAASGPPEPRALGRGIRWLQARGYRVEVAGGADARRGYLAGGDEARLGQLNAMLRRTDIRGIWFARGGYGGIRLLAGLDFAAARAHPKRLIGYSDLTSLQIALWRRCRLPSWYGPMVADLGRRPGSVHLGSLGSALRGGPCPPLRFPRRSVFRPGRAGGALVGGCLSVLCSLLGTPFEPDTRGAILFWEDVGEEPYRIDRYLYQLRLAGKLSGLRGMLVGALVDCRPRHGRKSLTLPEILGDVLEGYRYPVVTGLPFGHGPRKWTLPVGGRALLDTGRRRVRITAP